MLELRLRKSHGNSFQDFVGDFFGRLYPDDFIRVKAHGSLGDGGMDGFRQSNATLYQCYGAHNGHVHEINPVCDKLKQDFETARLKTPQMRRWLFTHNLTEVPRPLVDAFHETKARAADFGIEAGLCGFDTFRSLLSDFTEDDLEDLVGVAVYSNLDTDRLPENVNLIVKRLMTAMYAPGAAGRDVNIPPLDKLEYNAIPSRWRSNIIVNLQHAETVSAVLATDGKAAVQVPLFMRTRYLELKAQGLDPGATLMFLHEELAGRIYEYDGRYEAAMAMIAALFESCVIFEDKESSLETEPVP